MWSAMPGWAKFLLIVIALSWLGLLPTAIHMIISLADSARSAAHTAVHQNGGLTPLRSLVYHR